MDQVSIGRTVHYVLPDAEHRPATVVRVWGQPEEGNLYSGMCNLVVTLDTPNDSSLMGIDPHLQKDTIWRGSVYYSESPQPGTWHWPERA
jgi:hypothetical protein